jgi:phenylalanyl-tRNA synthetase beta chain
MDFYDLKGLLAGLFDALHIGGVHYEPHEHPSFHPGKCARVMVGEQQLGVMGELHPLVRQRYDLQPAALMIADLDFKLLISTIPELYAVQPVSTFPPVLEDLAVIVDEAVPAIRVEEVLRQGAGKILSGLRLFDVYRGEQIGAGKKSLAYGLTYQAPDRTLTDQEIQQIRQRIIRRLEQELGAKLRM